MNPEFACLQLDKWFIRLQNDENRKVSTIENLSSNSWYQATNAINLIKSYRLLHGNFSYRQ